MTYKNTLKVGLKYLDMINISKTKKAGETIAAKYTNSLTLVKLIEYKNKNNNNDYKRLYLSVLTEYGKIQGLHET